MDEARYPKFRHSFLYASTWRLIAELFQRHQTRFDLRVSQYYPGLSVHGIVAVTGSDGRRVKICLGAGMNGVVGFRQRESSTDKWLERFCWDAYLKNDEHGASLVDELCECIGWGRAEKGVSNGSIIVARTIASFLERYAASPMAFRTDHAVFDNAASAWSDDPLSYLAGWFKALPAAQTPSTLGVEKVVRIAQRHVVLCRFNEDTGNCQIPGEGAIAFDLGTSLATPLGAPERAVNLLAVYQKEKRSIRPLVTWVENEMKVK